MTLSEEGMNDQDPEEIRLRIAEELGIPVFLPLRDNLDELVEIIKNKVLSGGAL